MIGSKALFALCAADSWNGVNLHVKAKHTGSCSLGYHQKDRFSLLLPKFFGFGLR